jgi:hypothetical protein
MIVMYVITQFGCKTLENGCINEWTFLNCLWVMFVTFTTIGFGDIVPDVGTGLTSFVFWALFFFTLVAFGLVAALIETQQIVYYEGMAALVKQKKTNVTSQFHKDLVQFAVVLVVLLSCGAVIAAIEGPAEHERVYTRYAQLMDLSSALSQANLASMHFDTNMVMINDELRVLGVLKQQPKFNFSGSVFYWWTVMTTVGYGQAVPVTDAGKWFTMVCAVPSIVLYLKLVSRAGEYAVAAIMVCTARSSWNLSWGRSTRRIDNNNLSEPESESKSDDVCRAEGGIGIGMESTHGDGGAPLGQGKGQDQGKGQSQGKGQGKGQGQGQHQRPARLTFASLILIYVLAMASVVHLLSQDNCPEECVSDWSLANSLWFIVITFTTIGFGDVAPNVSAGSGVFQFWGLFLFALLGFGLVAALIETEQIEFYSKTAVVARSLAKTSLSVAGAGTNRIAPMMKERKSRVKSSKVGPVCETASDANEATSTINEATSDANQLPRKMTAPSDPGQYQDELHFQTIDL